jgi:hypothetical protein
MAHHWSAYIILVMGWTELSRNDQSFGLKID